MKISVKIIFLLSIFSSISIISAFSNKNVNQYQFLQSSQFGPAIKITNNTELMNFLPEQTGPGDSWENAYIIEGLQIDAGGTGAGLHLKDIDLYIIIRNNIIRSSTPSGLYTGGIQLNNCTNIRIQNNDAAEFDNGIFIIDSLKIEIIENIANHNSEDGIHLLDSSNCSIISNDASENSYYGITIKYSDYNVVLDNEASDNSFYGIYLEESNFNRIEKNTIKNNFLAGIYLTNSNDNTIIRNAIIGNREIIVEISSLNNIFERNKTNYLLEIILGSSGFVLLIGIGTFIIIWRKKKG